MKAIKDNAMPARTLSKKATINFRSKTCASPVSSSQIRSFRKKVYDYYDNQGRDLPWRKRVTPYRVLVSEIMLQQTQVDRVIEKYKEFLSAFPDVKTLAKAPLPKLLKIWSGMGYNRRALSLRKLAQVVVAEHKGRLTSDPDILVTLPGIGKYTAGAVAAFAFNKPVIFMDTNIRRVFIHEFFRDRQHIHDDELVPLVRLTLDTKNPRKWYNALMDYGAVLKKEHGNPNKRSVHYTRQSPFENSNRQVRGRIIKALVAGAPLTEARIVTETGMAAGRVRKNLDQLAREGFIVKKEDRYLIE
ncbi:MAG: A/G-specific adenine glycosylase [Nitrospirae bacterium]|nr:A/G-specific adenine glycosylase [Nitrospirota bacterium]NTW65257.1 A/G-specific adenine glycosylase [Nitrospirota bacterium]